MRTNPSDQRGAEALTMVSCASPTPAPGRRARGNSEDLSSKPREQQLVTDPLIEILAIHRAMRLEMQSIFDSLEEAGADAVKVPKALQRLERYAAVFRSHAAAEDDLLLPALALREAQLGVRADEDSGEHDDENAKLEAALAAVAAAAAACEASEPGAAAAVARAVAVLGDFKEFVANHMLGEEETVLPRLRRAFDRTELLRLTGGVMGRRTAGDVVSTLEIVVPNLEPQQARHVLATMSAVADRSKFRDWLQTLAKGPEEGGACQFCPRPAKRARGARRCPPAGPTYHCPYCNECRPGRGLGIDAFHCMRCNTCIPSPNGRASSREPRFLHVCGDAPQPYEVPETGEAPALKAIVSRAACACCGRDVFEALELLDALPCGHVTHARCLAHAKGTPVCRLCPRVEAPSSARKGSSLDLLASVINGFDPPK
mmetsp:Transcript_7936/g.23642  ORF Transcript_7936/g.23642 Transcript_7936/m.23642 type:complete len:430 (-) Transcript_7936:24-1313(-)